MFREMLNNSEISDSDEFLPWNSSLE